MYSSNILINNDISSGSNGLRCGNGSICKCRCCCGKLGSVTPEMAVIVLGIIVIVEHSLDDNGIVGGSSNSTDWYSQ